MSKRAMFLFIFSMLNLSGCFLDDKNTLPTTHQQTQAPEPQNKIVKPESEPEAESEPESETESVETTTVPKPPQNLAEELEKKVKEAKPTPTPTPTPAPATKQTKTTPAQEFSPNTLQTQSKAEPDSLGDAANTAGSDLGSISTPMNQTITPSSKQVPTSSSETPLNVNKASNPESLKTDQDSNADASANSSDVPIEETSADTEQNSALKAEEATAPVANTPPTEPSQPIFNANTPYRHYPIDCKTYGAYRCYLMEAPLDHHAENPSSDRIYLKYRLYRNANAKAKATVLISSLNQTHPVHWVLNKNTPQAALESWDLLQVFPRTKAQVPNTNNPEPVDQIKQHAQDVAHVYQQLLKKNLIAQAKPLIWLGQDLGAYAGLNFPAKNQLDKMILDFSVNNNSAVNAIEAQAPQGPALLINAPEAWQSQSNENHIHLQLANTEFHKTLWLHRIENIWPEPADDAPEDHYYNLIDLMAEYVNASAPENDPNHPLSPNSKLKWQFKKVSDPERNQARFEPRQSEPEFKPDLDAQFSAAQSLLPKVKRTQNAEDDSGSGAFEGESDHETKTEAQIEQGYKSLEALAERLYFPAILRLIQSSEITEKTMIDASDRESQWMQKGLKYLELKPVTYSEACQAMHETKPSLNAEFFNCLINSQVDGNWPLAFKHLVAHVRFRQGSSYKKRKRFQYYHRAYQYGHLEAGWQLWQKMNEFSQDNVEFKQNAEALLQALAEQGLVEAQKQRLETDAASTVTEHCQLLLGVAVQLNQNAPWIDQHHHALQACNLSPNQSMHFGLTE